MLWLTDQYNCLFVFVCFFLSSLVTFALFSLIVIAHMSRKLYFQTGGRHRGRDRMVIEFTTTYSTNETHRHDITAILLNLALNTIKQTNKQTSTISTDD